MLDDFPTAIGIMVGSELLEVWVPSSLSDLSINPRGVRAVRGFISAEPNTGSLLNLRVGDGRGSDAGPLLEGSRGGSFVAGIE